MSKLAKQVSILAVAVAAVSPLAARAGVIARSAEGPAVGTDWQLLGVIGPALLWGLPLAYVVFTVVTRLPRHPRVQTKLEEPREATFLDRLSLHADSRDGW